MYWLESNVTNVLIFYFGFKSGKVLNILVIFESNVKKKKIHEEWVRVSASV